MNLKELIAFQTILQEGTFSKAAEKLNYAQSTITNQIQRLEKDMGIPLFNRGWEAELTDSGRVLAMEIDKLIQHWNYVTDQAKALQKEETGSLRIGGLETMMNAVWPQVLHRFQQQKPGIACHFISGNTDALAQSIFHKQLDFAVCAEPVDFAPFHFEPLYNEKISLIVASDHPLLKNSAIVLEDILEQKLLIGGSTCLYHMRLAKQLSRYAKTPFLHTVSPISAIPHFVQQTSYVGAVLESTILVPGVVRINVDLIDGSIPVGLLQLRTDEYVSIPKKLFLQLIREELLDSF